MTLNARSSRPEALKPETLNPGPSSARWKRHLKAAHLHRLEASHANLLRLATGYLEPLAPPTPSVLTSRRLIKESSAISMRVLSGDYFPDFSADLRLRAQGYGLRA